MSYAQEIGRAARKGRTAFHQGLSIEDNPCHGRTTKKIWADAFLSEKLEVESRRKNYPPSGVIAGNYHFNVDF
jgi:hypothetical protein